MKPTFEQRDDFLARKPLPGIVLQHNDLVSIVLDEHAGSTGSIVSVEQLGEDPIYLVELESGQDMLVRQSALIFLASGHES